MNFVQLFKKSADEFKSIPSLVGCSMLGAVKIIISAFTITLIPGLLKLGFSGHVLGMIGMLYGPTMAGVAAFVLDFLEFITSGSAQGGYYFPGFALNAVIGGILYGIFFYQKKEIRVRDVIMCRLLLVVSVNLILTPIWLNIMYGTALLSAPRVIKAIVTFPFDCAILYFLLNTTLRIKKHR